MGKRRGSHLDNVAGGIAQGLMAYLAMQQRQESLDMQRSTNKAHAAYYKARADEINREGEDAKAFGAARIGAGASSEVPVGAGGPGTAAATSRDLDPTTGLDPAMRDVDAAMPPAEVSQASPSGARSVASAPKAGGIMGGLDSRFRERLLAAAAEQGVDLKATDGYRDLPGQQDVRDRKGSLAANPGYSVHGARLAADIDPTQADVLEKSGALDRAGLHRPFAHRAKNPEPWHVEPLGVDTAAARAQMAAAMAANPKQDPTKLDYANFYTPQGGQYATTQTAGAAPQAAPQQAAAGLDTSNMLADAGNSVSDAGSGYRMKGAAPQAAPQAAGLNPAQAKALVPQSRAGMTEALAQRAQQLLEEKKRLEAFQPSSAKWQTKKDAELNRLEREEQWLYGQAKAEQVARESAAKDAATQGRQERSEGRATAAAERANQNHADTLAHQKTVDTRAQKAADRADSKEWAASIKGEAEASARFQSSADTEDQTKGEKYVNPRKANTLRQAMVAHYGEMVPDGKGGITPAFKDGNKDVADITTKMGTFSKKYDQALADLQKKFPNEGPAKLESLIDHNTIFKMIDRDVDLANKAAAAQQKATGAAAEQAAPSAPSHVAPATPATPATQQTTGMGLDPQAVPEAAPTRRGLNPQAAAPDLAGQYVNAGDAARVPSPPRVPSMSEVEMALTDARNKPTWAGAKWVGEQLGKIQPTTETQDFSLSGDSPAVQRPDVAVTSPFKRADESAQILNRYQSGTPEERAVIEELYPQIKDFSSTALGEGPM